MKTPKAFKNIDANEKYESGLIDDDAAWVMDVLDKDQVAWMRSFWEINLPNLLLICNVAKRYNRRYFIHNVMDGFPEIPTSFQKDLRRLCREMPLDLWAFVADDSEPEEIKAKLATVLYETAKVMAGEMNLSYP